MTFGDRTPAALAALAIVAALVGAAVSQEAPATAPATGAAPAIKIEQPREFTELAAKAGRMEGVHVKGVGTMESRAKGEKERAVMKVDLEVWVKGPRVRLAVGSPVTEQRAGDGTYAYLLRVKGDGMTGVRKRLTDENLYLVLPAASAILDATGGYANLASAGRMVPLPADAERDAKFGELKWFRIVPVAASHPIFALARQVTAGFDPKDGLVRALVCEQETDEKLITLSHVWGPAGKDVRDEDLLLPREAAGAAWVDADDENKAIAAPVEVIAKP